ncbi:hypothetical protein IEE94_14425 [Yimella sp. cx-573]|nr:hypothetical protein [Yimella sp. cx-573]
MSGTADVVVDVRAGMSISRRTMLVALSAMDGAVKYHQRTRALRRQ